MPCRGVKLFHCTLKERQSHWMRRPHSHPTSPQLTGKYSGGRAPEGSRLSGAIPSYQFLVDAKLGTSPGSEAWQVAAADALAPLAAELGCRWVGGVGSAITRVAVHAGAHMGKRHPASQSPPPAPLPSPPCRLAQLSIAWVLANPAVSSVLLGATSVAQLEENLGALAVLPRLTPEMLRRCAAAAGERAQPKLGKVEGQLDGMRGRTALIEGPHTARGAPVIGAQSGTVL